MADATASGVSHRRLVSYIDRTREYYQALGYEHPYRWARHQSSPFQPLVKPLRESTLAIVTTASLAAPEGFSEDAPLGRKELYSMPTRPVPEWFFTQDLSWHKEATHTDDPASFFPAREFQSLVEQGRLGSLAQRSWGVPTDFSQRRTRELDAPRILEGMREDEVDVAVLVPL